MISLIHASLTVHLNPQFLSRCWWFFKLSKPALFYISRCILKIQIVKIRYRFTTSICNVFVWWKFKMQHDIFAYVTLLQSLYEKMIYWLVFSHKNSDLFQFVITKRFNEQLNLSVKALFAVKNKGKITRMFLLLLLLYFVCTMSNI